MKKRVIILGGGFVGTSVAVKLAKRRRDIEIILISQQEAFSFSPLLIDVLAQELPAKKSRLSLSQLSIQHRFTFLQGEVLELNRETHEVHFRNMASEEQTLSYDYVVLATGSKVNYYNIPGAAEFCLPLKREEDVQRIWQQINKKILEKQGSISVAIIGGGPTGIESLYAIKNYLHKQNIDQPAVHLFEATPMILPGFDQKIQESALKALQADGIHIHLGKPVQQISPLAIQLPELAIQYDIALWCAGIQPNIPQIIPSIEGPLCADINLRLDERTFLAGDVATVEQQGKKLPKTGQIALQLAEAVTQNIQRALFNQPLIQPQPVKQALLLSLGKTGLIHLGSYTVKTSLTAFLRRSIYRLRRWQIQTGR